MAEDPKENQEDTERLDTEPSTKPEAEKKRKSETIPKLSASAKNPAAKTGDKSTLGRGKKADGKSGSAPTVAELLATDSGPAKIIKAKGSKNIPVGIANIFATFNNTLVSISDMQGNVIAWSSAGKIGFKGSRKSTAFAAQQVSQDVARQAMSHGLKEVEVRVKGPGSGRESAIRALQAIGLEISSIKDVTPVPHNGCRPRKRRRV